MGYILYWERPKEIDRELFISIVTDFKKVLPYLTADYKVKLAGSHGYQEPTIDEYAISFNGATQCGHRNTMPDFSAMVDLYLEGVPLHSPLFKPYLNDDWATRRCPGDCCFEEFCFPRVDWRPRPNTQETRYWGSCKTNRRHYELAIQVALIAAKRHMGGSLELDGVEHHWTDARRLCQKYLGYGTHMKLWEEPKKQAA